MTEFFKVMYEACNFQVTHSVSHHGESWRVFNSRGNVISQAAKVEAIKALCNESTKTNKVTI